MTMLDSILASTVSRIAGLPSLAELRARAADSPPPRDFAAAVTGDGLAVIAEIKRRSPSRGVLAPDLRPAEQAVRYAAGGAAAISVLTEPSFFQGSDRDLVEVRSCCELPVLRKDFTLDPAQVWEARALGADAVLLIVAALDDATLRRLLEVSSEAGMAAVVEVHSVEEAERAMTAGARIVGVNNRDLRTFEVDLATAERLAPVIADADIRIAESGILTGDDAARMAAAGYHAVLVGESLVTSLDPTEAIHRLRRAAGGRR